MARPQVVDGGRGDLVIQTVAVNTGVYLGFRTGRLERELQMIQLSATGCSCIAIL